MLNTKFNTLQPTLYTVRPRIHTLHPKLKRLHPSPYCHPTLYTGKQEVAPFTLLAEGLWFRVWPAVWLPFQVRLSLSLPKCTHTHNTTNLRHLRFSLLICFYQVVPCDVVVGCGVGCSFSDEKRLHPSPYWLRGSLPTKRLWFQFWSAVWLPSPAGGVWGGE